jgi:polar amino acid transport system substrate-binding protein
MSQKWKRWVPVLVATVGCGLPRDSAGTIDRVRGGVIRVGVVIDTPWTTDSTGEVGGIEGAMVRMLGRDLNARVNWLRGSEGDLLSALENRELDLVIGGLSVASPWQKRVAFTRPYYVDTVSIGGAPNEPPPASLEGVRVALKSGDPAAADVRKKGVTPQFVPRLDSVRGPIAAPTWQLAQLARRENPSLRLMQTQHVLAAAPGENAFLVRVEQTLIDHRAEVPALLRRSQ